MRRLQQMFITYHISIMILITFLVSIFVATNVWANGDWEYDCPKTNCPDVTVNCDCPTAPPVRMAAEEPPKEKKVQLSGGIRLGYHAYTGNDFLNGLPDADQGAFNSPSGDQPFPPIEGEFNVSILPLKYFSVSALIGTYTGKSTNSLGVLSSTQTIYFLAMPRFDYSFDFKIKDTPITINPYLGAGLGFAYFTFWRDPAFIIFPPSSAVDEQHVVFAWTPSIGFDVPLLAVDPAFDPEGMPTWIDKARLKLLVDYRYIGANYKSFNAGGHLFLVGLGMDF